MTNRWAGFDALIAQAATHPSDMPVWPAIGLGVYDLAVTAVLKELAEDRCKIVYNPQCRLYPRVNVKSHPVGCDNPADDSRCFFKNTDYRI